MHQISKYYHFIPSLQSHHIYTYIQPLMLQHKAIIALPINTIMEYDWGSSSKSNLIYQLTKEEHTKYAQLWMGTHKNGPSMLDHQITLQKYLESLGVKELPFLFKILCIQKALSIQLHPNKPQAQKLNGLKPQIYDNNQKPEMFYTITEFQCFFGTISIEAFNYMIKISPFSRLKTKSSLDLREIIKEIISIKQQEKKFFIDQIMDNIDLLFPERKTIMDKLQLQFPYDIGIAVSCLLNYQVLPPGQCYAIAAGIPHAYVSGTCLQIMKNSDNVVRLGLTPKLKDVETMLEIINNQFGLQGLKVQNTEGGYSWNSLMILEVKCQGQKVIQLKRVSIGIVLQGKCEVSEWNFIGHQGSIFLLHPGQYMLKGCFSLYVGSHSDQT